MAPTTPCRSCGAPLPLEARHCPGCGAPVEVASGAPGAPGPPHEPGVEGTRAPAGGGGGLGKATVLGMALPEGFAAIGTASAPPPPSPPSLSSSGPIGGHGGPVSAARVVSISGAGAVEARVVPGTMMGLRVDPAAASVRGAAPIDDKKRTMLGVALPGIAPAHDRPAESRRAPSFVPPPPPPHASQALPVAESASSETPVLPAGASSRGRGAAIALVVFVGLCAAAAAIVWTGSAPAPRLIVERRAAPGGDALIVGCAACPDHGSSIRVAGKESTFAAGSASITLPPDALAVGKNALPATLAIGRRSWTLTLDLVVPFAAHVGLERLGTDGAVDLVLDVAPQVVAAHVEERSAKPVDGRVVFPVALTPTRDGGRSITREVPFTVDLADGTHRDGALTIALPVAPLKLATPRVGEARTWTLLAFGGKAILAGKSAPHAKLTTGATSTSADDAGGFRLEPDLSGATTLSLLVVAPGLAPRTTEVAVMRAASPEGALAELRGRVTTPTATLVLDPDAHAGEWLVGVVDVAQARDEDGRTIAAGDLRCGGSDPAARCAAVRVLLPPGVSAAGGDVLRVAGVVVRGVPIDQGKKKAPEVDAIVAIPGK